MGYRKIKKPMFVWLTSFLVTGTLAVAMGSGEKVKINQYESVAENNDCTILVYMDGSNLESNYEAATSDLQEMEAAMKGDEGNNKVRIVIEAGGSTEWHYEPIAGNDYTRFTITSEGVSDIQNMDIRNMGEPSTLADFINYGTQSYPSEHYGLILWNHGAGQIDGFGNDSNFNGDSLNLAELSDAFDELAKYQKFDFISLDACLMANYELASVLENNTKYLIASEELEPQDGHDYSWIKAIVEMQEDNEQKLGEIVGKKMLETYEEFYQEEDFRITLSLVDTSAYENFNNLFSQILNSVIEQSNDELYQQIGRERKLIQGFGYESQNELAEIIDLMDFAQLIAAITGQRDTYKELENQYSSLVIDKVSNGYADEPSGLSIYLPSASSRSLISDLVQYKKISFCEPYQLFLEQYEEYLLAENKLKLQKAFISENVLNLKLDKENIENITAAYLEIFCQSKNNGRIYLISSDSNSVQIDKNEYLKASAKNTCWGIKGQPLCMIEILSTEEYSEYVAPILYNGEYCNMLINFEESHPDGKIVSIEPMEVQKQIYQAKEGDIIIPLYPMYMPEIVELPQNSKKKSYVNTIHQGTEIVIERIENGNINLEQIEINLEDYWMRFQIQDSIQNVYYTEILKIISSCEKVEKQQISTIRDATDRKPAPLNSLNLLRQLF